MPRILRYKYCGWQQPYQPRGANFILLCPDCRAVLHLECEYGYGPVPPCPIDWREREVGRVTAEPNRVCWLEAPALPVPRPLAGKSLAALQEGAEIVRALLPSE